MSYTSFDDVWRYIMSLKGEYVSTLYNPVKNYIQEVNEKGVTRLSARARDKGKSTNVPKAEFEKVWRNLREHGKFVPNGKGGWGIACACIARLPNVEYSCKDRILALYLRKQNTHLLGQPYEER